MALTPLIHSLGAVLRELRDRYTARLPWMDLRRRCDTETRFRLAYTETEASLNGWSARMLSAITGRSIRSETKQPSVVVTTRLVAGQMKTRCVNRTNTRQG